MNRPPALSRVLLEWTSQRLGTPELAEDAAELYSERFRLFGSRAARRWYRRQVRSSLWQLLLPPPGTLRSAVAARRLTGLSLDVRLALRMLARYPGLTIVGGLAMAFAIFVGAATFEFVKQNINPTLPLPDGERVVGLRYWNIAGNGEELPHAEDLRAWEAELHTVVHLGAFQTLERNLVVGDEAGEPVQVARISPAGFQTAGVQPLFGRFLVGDDARPGEPRVVVVGHRVWQSRFGSDPGVLGRTLTLDGIEATVVGVMPEGFRFPRTHDAWIPLRAEDLIARSGARAPVRVFGRLAPGATLEEAQREVSALSARAARDAPERYRHLTAQVLPYADSLFSRLITLRLRALVYQINLFAVAFLVLVCANVALLMFARAAARAREILVRHALGATRRRIVTQFFVEALILGVFASVLGLLGVGPGLQWLYQRLREMGGDLPFWFVPALSTSTMVYALLLTVAGAAVAGVIPALKVTARRMETRLREAGAGTGGLRVGGFWTGVIVVQIAATFVFTGVACVVVRQAFRSASVEASFPAGQYVGVRLEVDRDDKGGARTADTFAAAYGADVQEFKARVAASPLVGGVALAEHLPLKFAGFTTIEVDRASGTASSTEQSTRDVFASAVDLDFFDVLRTSVLSGRRFDSRDLSEGVKTVLVNASFVNDVLGGQNPIGQRIRYIGDDPDRGHGPWYEIVGVVADLATVRTQSLDLETMPTGRVYHPLDPARIHRYPVHLVAHVRGRPGELLPAFYRTAAAVSPALRVEEPVTLDRANQDIIVLWRLWAQLAGGVSGVALFLSLAGIYSAMTFTVARRRREIGVRVAMGASPPRVVIEIFRTPIMQIGSGLILGCALFGVLIWDFTEGRATAVDGVLMLGFGCVLAGVCALACVGPTLRALGVEPAQALAVEE